jgi:nucleoside-diphosphate-sugar epimerase
MIVVTGAAGAVGSHVVDLLREGEETVVATDLPSVCHQIRGGSNIQIIPSDLRRPTSTLTNLVQVTNSVIHTAAIVDLSATWEDLVEANVRATETMLVTAPYGSQFVHISSASVYAPSPVPIMENHQLLSTSAYEASKVEAEALVRHLGTRWYILRPSLIYGPRTKHLGAALAAVPPLMPRIPFRKTVGLTGGPVISWTHAEDIARAAIFCLRHNEARKVFNVADNTPLGFGDTVSEYLKAYGLDIAFKASIPPPGALEILGRLPYLGGAFKPLNVATKRLWQALRIKNDLVPDLRVKLDKEALDYATRDTVISSLNIQRAGFELKWPDSREAIPSTIEWYKAHKWIP